MLVGDGREVEGVGDPAGQRDRRIHHIVHLVLEVAVRREHEGVRGWCREGARMADRAGGEHGINEACASDGASEKNKPSPT